MRAVHSTVVIALLLTGCGGGGGSDTAVSANPPAAEPPVAAAPTPAPTPIAAPPSKTPAPVETPDPETPSEPPAGETPAAGPSVSAVVLESALRMMYEPTSHASFAPFQGTGADSNVYISQATIQSVYQFATGLYFDPGDSDPPRYEVRNALVRTPSVPDLLLGQALEVRDDLGVFIPMSSAGGFNVTQPSYALDQTIAEWRAGDYFAQLQVQTDPASNTAFRLCWHLRTERIIRLACGRHDRLTGEFRGIVLVDDSLGLGPLTWQTQ